jgi:hypothetical protein
MIAFDLGYRVIDETMFGAHFEEKFRNILQHRKNIVIHAPAMSHIVHTLVENVAVVFMIRNENDIIKSEKRIGWPDFENDREIEKYRELRRYYDNRLNKSCDVKQAVWDNFQKDVIKHRYEVLYNSLKGHPLYKRKEDRLYFQWNQVK